MRRTTTLATIATTAAFAAAAQQQEAGGAPVLTPETRNFVQSLQGSEPIQTLSPEAARDVLASAQANPGDMPPAAVEPRTLPVEPTGETDVVVVTPEGAEGPLPAVVYFHGGGWVLGDFSTHERLVREIATRADAVVVFVDYARSPEAKHPTALEQDAAVVRHVAQNPGAFGVDAERLALAGDSVGGHMAAVVPMMLAEEAADLGLDAAVLFYPVTSAALDTESYERFADGPWLTKPAMEWFWSSYLPEDAERDAPFVSPLEAPLESLAALPPTLVITAENDVLRDEGEAFAERLVEAGVPVESTRHNLTIHDFVMLNALSDTPPANAAVEQAVGFLREHLHED